MLSRVVHKGPPGSQAQKQWLLQMERTEMMDVSAAAWLGRAGGCAESWLPAAELPGHPWRVLWFATDHIHNSDHR